MKSSFLRQGLVRDPWRNVIILLNSDLILRTLLVERSSLSDKQWKEQEFSIA